MQRYVLPPNYLFGLFIFGLIPATIIQEQYPSFNMGSLSPHPRLCQQCFTSPKPFLSILDYVIILSFKNCNTVGQKSLLFPHFLTLILNKATNRSLSLKRGVLKSRRPSGKRCRPVPNLWHEWNKWMKENENGWGVISGRQFETSANSYEWETAAELMKKKEMKDLTFFYPPSKNN